MKSNYKYRRQVKKQIYSSYLLSSTSLAINILLVEAIQVKVILESNSNTRQ